MELPVPVLAWVLVAVVVEEAVRDWFVVCSMAVADDVASAVVV